MDIDYGKLACTNLKRFRNERKMSQTELADGMGIGYSHYNRIETGKVQPTIESISKAAKALGNVEVYEFFIPVEVASQPISEKWKQFEELPDQERETIERIINITLERERFLNDVK